MYSVGDILILREKQKIIEGYYSEVDSLTSIFTINRRKNFKESYDKFISDLQTVVETTTGKNYKMIDYLNYCIRYWPYRCDAISIGDYLSGMVIDTAINHEQRQLLLALELYINLLYWAPKQDSADDRDSSIGISFKKNDVEKEAKRFLDNIRYMLEQCCNMYIRKKDEDLCPKYFITKKSAIVDAAAISEPELSDILLSYFDIRNEFDINFKKNALTNIYTYMEPYRPEYKKLVCSAVSEEFFTDMNVFGIRHNTKSQVRMNGKKKMDTCDKLFMMALYVLQTKTVNAFKEEMKGLRDKN